MEGLSCGVSVVLDNVTGAGTRIEGVWKVADKLRGHFKPHKYGCVMLPPGHRARMLRMAMPSVYHLIAAVRHEPFGRRSLRA